MGRVFTIAVTLSFVLPACESARTVGGDPCVHARDCDAGTTCIEGTCTASMRCTTSRVCPGLVCDRTLGVCVECLSAADCSGGFACRSGVCEAPGVTCASDRDCSAMALVCDALGGVCVDCVRDVDCAATERCSSEHACVAAGSDAGVPVDGSRDTGPAADGGHDAALRDAAVRDAAVRDAAVLDTGAPIVACDPATIPGVSLWLEGDRSVLASAASIVTAWSDVSGSGAILDTSLGMPVLTRGLANGHDAIALRGATLTQRCGACTPWPGGTPFLVTVVYRVDGASAGSIWSLGMVGGPMSVQVVPNATDGSLYLGLANIEHFPVPLPLTPLGTWHVLSFFTDGRSLQPTLDRRVVLDLTDPVTMMLANDGPLAIGPFAGSVAEVVVAHGGGLTTRQRDCVETFMMERYAIP